MFDKFAAEDTRFVLHPVVAPMGTEVQKKEGKGGWGHEWLGLRYLWQLRLQLMPLPPVWLLVENVAFLGKPVWISTFFCSYGATWKLCVPAHVNLCILVYRKQPAAAAEEPQQDSRKEEEEEGGGKEEGEKQEEVMEEGRGEVVENGGQQEEMAQEEDTSCKQWHCIAGQFYMFAELHDTLALFLSPYICC